MYPWIFLSIRNKHNIIILQDNRVFPSGAQAKEGKEREGLTRGVSEGKTCPPVWTGD